ncbi:hypothetical protein GCM10022409_14580 [Hymenobacter glaciei]|uniref:DUF4249 domain-containing protein n=1 Tax=Hymenobacter glaciei TaxID=877209 RepID=A0ABP7TUE2_9BACT
MPHPPSSGFRPSLRALSTLLLLAAGGCTDPYLPEVAKSPPSYLVVDGFLNSQGPTSVKLTRTYAIGAAGPAPVEARAAVYVEEENGPRTLLREAPAGTYSSPTALTFNPARRYRLHLNTAGGKEYASDFVPVKNTPPIDELSWRADADGLSISLSTHDPANAARYYRWNYVETWQIDPIYSPQVEYRPNTLPLPDITVVFPTKCWASAPSTTVLLANTTPLSQDVVTDRLLRQVPSTSERLHSGYSILVQQQALTKEEFAYWELLRKNTENIGSLFDAQPAQLTGNVHCLSNSTEPVLGFVGAHSVTEKRLFVARRELPAAWLAPSGYEACYPPDTLWLAMDPLISLQSFFGNGSILPIEKVSDHNETGYTAQTRDCIDCRTRGTSVKPSFWP